MTTSIEVRATNGQPVPATWNETAADFPNVCAHELFEQQAARTPDAIAVVSGGHTMTYGDLNARANKVAHFLRRRGVGPDTLVGICFRRTPDLVVALLAVWKAGGAYVPLDPSYPPERLSFMLADARAHLLLTEEASRPLFASAASPAI